MRNEDVLEAFRWKDSLVIGNLSTDGTTLKSYDLVIAEHKPPHEAEVTSGIVIYWRFKKPNGSYSATTLKHLYALKRYLENNRVSHRIITNEEEMP